LVKLYQLPTYSSRYWAKEMCDWFTYPQLQLKIYWYIY